MILRAILKAMCSNYNGIQVFMDSGSLFYWLSSTSLLWAFTSLFQLRIHYLPLVMYLIMFVYVGFMILKIYTSLFEGPHKLFPNRMNEFFDYIIKLHLYLFITLMVLMVFYVFTKFLSYFYAINLPLNRGIWITFRGFTIVLILAYYVRHMWLLPLRQRGYDVGRCECYCLAWIKRNPIAALKYSAILVVLIVLAVRMYQIVIYYILSPLLVYLTTLSGLKLNIELLPVSGVGSVFYNVFMLFAAFMLSNLLFYPIIHLAQMLVTPLHPMRLKQVTNAQS